MSKETQELTLHISDETLSGYFNSCETVLTLPFVTREPAFLKGWISNYNTDENENKGCPHEVIRRAIMSTNQKQHWFLETTAVDDRKGTRLGSLNFLPAEIRTQGLAHDIGI